MSFTVIQCSKCQHHTRVEDGKTQAVCYNCSAALFTPSDPDPRQTKIDTRGTFLDLTEVRAKAYAFDSLLMHFATVTQNLIPNQKFSEAEQLIGNNMLKLMKKSLEDGRQRATAKPISGATLPLQEKS